mgnify:CR=1 FL=1
MAPKAKSDGVSKSKSHKAGLIFPVSKEFKSLRKGWKGRVSGKSPVYMAGLLEFVAAEILQAAGEAAKDSKVKRITPALLSRAIREDADLHKLLGGARLFIGDKVGGIADAITHDDDKKRAAKKKADKLAAEGKKK